MGIDNEAYEAYEGDVSMTDFSFNNSFYGDQDVVIRMPEPVNFGKEIKTER